MHYLIFYDYNFIVFYLIYVDRKTVGIKNIILKLNH